MLAELPPWCNVEVREGPLLVVAPHGGLCVRDLLSPQVAASVRSNDLHSTEVARLLADRLGASLIANVAVDRNELDLNRISEVGASVPWFFDLMTHLVERILDRHRVAEVLFVHGWHVVQPRCDVGIGASLAQASDAEGASSRLTVTPSYVLERLEDVRRSFEKLGIRTTYGEKWPAAHRNNVMQIFRHRRRRLDDGQAPSIGRFAAAGRTQAVQLELGAPLRWPGPWRERFLEALAATFGPRPSAASRRTPSASDDRDAKPAPASIRNPASGGAPAELHAACSPEPAKSAVALQVHDAAAGQAGLGVVVGVGSIGGDEIGGRLLLLPGGQRMLLFTGHERARAGRRLAVGGLEVEGDDDNVVIRFRGPVLDIPDASLYFRHEAAQLDAQVTELELALRFVAAADRPYGRVEGEARAGGASWRIAAHGFTDPILARPKAHGSVVRTRLTASFGDELGVTAELSSAPGSGEVVCLVPSGSERCALEAGAPMPIVDPGRLAGPFAIGFRGRSRLLCEPLSHVTILRPLSSGVLARITFGAASFELDGSRRGSGFYEQTTELTAGRET